MSRDGSLRCVRRTISRTVPKSPVPWLWGCPHTSRYAIGSCNWVVRSQTNDPFCYVTASSNAIDRHPAPLDHTPLRGAGTCVLTGLTRHPTSQPDAIVGEMLSHIASTVKLGGSVLIPTLCTGVVYDLLELVVGRLVRCARACPHAMHSLDERPGGLNVRAPTAAAQCSQAQAQLREVPVLFVSPAAKTSLKYANICSNWYVPHARAPDLHRTDRPSALSRCVRACCQRLSPRPESVNARFCTLTGCAAQRPSEFRMQSGLLATHPS